MPPHLIFFMQLFFPTIAVLFDILPGALGVVAAVVVSFVAITLVASYYRFQNIVKQAEETQPEEMGATPIKILSVQLARYLARCSRRGATFSIALIQVNDSSVEVGVQSPFIEAVKKAARCDDTTCVYDQQTTALLIEAEPEDSESILARITSTVAQSCPDITRELLRVGIGSYPGHGLIGKNLIEAASEALAQTNTERQIILSEIKDEDVEDGEVLDQEDESNVEVTTEEEIQVDNEDSRGWKGRRSSAMLDDLTGVLKPSAISAYMERKMSDLRHKKKKATLFCIGVNNIDHVLRIHGEDAADDVLAGISKILQDNIRADDLIGRHEKYAFLALSQNTLEEAETIGKRISTLVQQAEMVSGSKKLKTTITLGVAAYPEHGRNLHMLYRAGQKVLDYNRANDIRAYAVYDPEIHDSMPSKPMKSIKSVQA